MSTAITSKLVNASPEILNSWKEIARYLDRGVRTVQRWEDELGLPVRRPHGRGRSAVFAVRSEVDVWLRACPLERHLEIAASRRMPVEASTRDLLLEARRLRAHLRTSRMELDDALLRLVQTLGKMSPRSQ